MFVCAPAPACGLLLFFNSAAATAAVALQDDLKARYWRYLFDNLNRAIDELYLTCEHDESAIECEEVIMILANAKVRLFVWDECKGNPPHTFPSPPPQTRMHFLNLFCCFFFSGSETLRR